MRERKDKTAASIGIIGGSGRVGKHVLGCFFSKSNEQYQQEIDLILYSRDNPESRGRLDAAVRQTRSANAPRGQWPIQNKNFAVVRHHQTTEFKNLAGTDMLLITMGRWYLKQSDKDGVKAWLSAQGEVAKENTGHLAQWFPNLPAFEELVQHFEASPPKAGSVIMINTNPADLWAAWLRQRFHESEILKDSVVQIVGCGNSLDSFRATTVLFNFLRDDLRLDEIEGGIYIPVVGAHSKDMVFCWSQARIGDTLMMEHRLWKEKIEPQLSTIDAEIRKYSGKVSSGGKNPWYPLLDAGACFSPAAAITGDTVEMFVQGNSEHTAFLSVQLPDNLAAELKLPKGSFGSLPVKRAKNGCLQIDYNMLRSLSLKEAEGLRTAIIHNIQMLALLSGKTLEEVLAEQRRAPASVSLAKYAGFHGPAPAAAQQPAQQSNWNLCVML